MLYYLVPLFTIIVGIIFSLYFAKRRSEPINALINKINKIPSNQNLEIDNGFKYASYELNVLFNSFKDVFNKLKQQIELSTQNSIQLEKQNTELQQVNKELDHFVYSISHDLRAPLTSVMGLIELMKTEPNENMQKKYLELMNRSVLRLDSFIHDILDYSRNNRIQISPSFIDFKEILDEIFENFEFLKTNTKPIKNITKTNNIKGFYGDKNRIKIILNNLISNAIKYADFSKENSFIEIELTETEKTIIIKISDNGIGIEDKHLEKVFNMFYRGTDKSKGSGLGLYIVGETVKTLKGKISFNSIYGFGTSATIELPKLN